MLTINWMSEEGVHSLPFNSDYFRLDPLGYLDALSKGRDMEDVHVMDADGNDVTGAHF